MRLLWLLLAWLAFGEVYAQSKCGIEIVDDSSSSSSIKRSVGFLRLERNVTWPATSTTALAKRMQLPGSLESLGEFYEKELPKISKPIATRDEAPEATWMSAAILQEFGRLRRKEWSTGLEGLKGCTTLYIISRKAVYATHWWENVSFDPDDEWRDPPTQTDAELFQLTVTDMLRDGGRYHRKLDADLIEDDYIRAYLIRPAKPFRQLEDPNAADYTIQWNQIRDTVGELVPTLQDPSRWTDIAYETVKEDDELFIGNTVRGRNLFKYDRAQDIGGGQTQQWAMLWVEGQKYHEDKW
ncbi:hypothetical protein ALT_2396 [Aspergillus lentulus]|uniref:Uncharacterized protein n=1 Tax=Aspergillus lentulus TaxID=293939 RepID=A0AAN4T878_ASPLE|nr:hypothetical protein CNMCM6936_001772 [Aspergillus lentulus]KAF4172534.1 hypothetical protein CNMCM8060_001401 [Aspergillus lentulus]KAF4179575.1 hypothetical protein CNMCM7927_001824 [Aspergillus lentulus]KAF4191965.1 hypothetical protein CNMCM8694_001041 [Aspergillus lentulus]GAQ05075.1 hypothetical protein ALT_2396 [Aspergillus lentulus]